MAKISGSGVRSMSPARLPPSPPMRFLLGGQARMTGRAKIGSRVRHAQQPMWGMMATEAVRREKQKRGLGTGADGVRSLSPAPSVPVPLKIRIQKYHRLTKRAPVASIAGCRRRHGATTPTACFSTWRSARTRTKRKRRPPRCRRASRRGGRRRPGVCDNAPPVRNGVPIDSTR